MPELFVFCLDILLYKDVNGKLTKKLYDKVEILIFQSQIHLLILKKTSSPANSVLSHSLFVMQCI